MCRRVELSSSLSSSADSFCSRASLIALAGVVGGLQTDWRIGLSLSNGRGVEERSWGEEEGEPEFVDEGCD